ncbi:MAG TPA: glycosyltransferase family 4 protein [Bryobacteraceae bacterium]|jgi:glycosyltransferase involved in cell wall biosynthesis|nr:glycosyltransferase family 4 protein [Bryobacteraceae bacterium]
MPAPVPVLLIVRELSLGGSERQVAEIAKSLDRSRFDPRVGCFRPGGLRAHDLRTAGVPIINFSVPSLVSVKGLLRIARYIREENIQLVHTFDTPANLYGVPAARLAGAPVVLSSQRVDRALWPAAERHALRIVDRLTDGIVVNCEFLRRHLRDEEKVPATSIHLCYNGIDTGSFYPQRGSRPEALRNAALVVGVVCSLRPEKGLSTLLDAFAALRACVPAVKLAIVGGGPCLAELQQRACLLGIFPDCIFEPATPQVAAWLRAMDIFVLPSLSEALSNSLMEAMACGCCVAASRIGGNPELVIHGETGMLFTPRDVTELAEVLRLLAGAKALRDRLASNAVHLIESRFSLEAAARRMAEIYSSLLA